jgi:nucleoside 2-deoxyribosyltransferase
MPHKNHKNIIYLAGGFRSGWQAGVIKQLPEYKFLDPSQHNIKEPKEYTNWDLDAIRQCDIVLANMEPTNPGGYSLALEVGYARALNKTVVFVDQIEDATVSRYFEMVRQCSDLNFKTLDQAVNHLSQG